MTALHYAYTYVIAYCRHDHYPMPMAARWKQLVPNSWSTVIGMIHVEALPGTKNRKDALINYIYIYRHLIFLLILGAPRNCLSIGEIVSKAVKEAEIYRRCGLHGVIVENMHDVPYLHGGVGSEVTACMTRVASEVRTVVKHMILGVQILSSECT